MGSGPCKDGNTARGSVTFTPWPVPKEPMTLAQAIARMEGFYAAGQVPNRPQRNNNPGDLEFTPFTQHFGAMHGDPRFAVFPSIVQGFEALEGLLKEPSYINLTVQEAVARYAPANENDVAIYTAAVCHWTGRRPGDVLGTFLEEA